MSAEFYQSGPETMATRFGGPNVTPISVGSPISNFRMDGPTRGGSTVQPQTAAATGAGMPSPVTWLVGAIILLFVLKFLGERESSPINPAHVHIGGYNVLTIFVIVVITVVGMKILVNRPFFGSNRALAGFASLVNTA